jgi:Na+-transporting NADH:ubiquinone oxidoreductase subunit NqrD
MLPGENSFIDGLAKGIAAFGEHFLFIKGKRFMGFIRILGYDFFHQCIYQAHWRSKGDD